MRVRSGPTAESAEIEEQLSFLRDSGCGAGQRFLFGKAVSGAEANELVNGSGEADAKQA